MNIKENFLLLMFTALFVLSCSKEKDTPLFTKNITIDASINDLTRATDTDFEDDDIVGVYAWTGDNSVIATPDKTDYTYSSSSSSWSSEDPLTWSDLTTDYYFMGVYPTRDITDFTADNYTLDLSDQEASDLLIATNVESGLNGSRETPIPLVFVHSMAKLTINLTYKSEFLSTPTVESVELSAGTTGTINYLNKTVTLTGDPETISLPEVTANTQYASFMIPQTIEDINININGTTYTYSPDTAITLESGKNKVLNLVVGKDGEVSLTFSINSWIDDIDDGEALEIIGYH